MLLSKKEKYVNEIKTINRGNVIYPNCFNHETERLLEQKPKRPSATKGRKIECYPIEIEQLHQIANWFIEKKFYHHFLILALCFYTARRISDILALHWNDLYNPDGSEKQYIMIQEGKTKKYIQLIISEHAWKCIRMYIGYYHIKPEKNNYTNYVFKRINKGTVITYEAHRVQLKNAVDVLDIKHVNVSTHTYRKTSALFMYMYYSDDPLILPLISDLLNHSEEKITRRYLGLHQKKRDTLMSCLVLNL